MYKGNTHVEMRKPQKSKFDLSEKKRLTTAMGRLTPILIKEAVPSDTFRGSSEVLLRLAPLLAPIYDDIKLYVHYFFVPNRLIWSEWETFITGGRLGVGIDPVTEPIPPYVNIYSMWNDGYMRFDKSSLFDYIAGCTLPQTGTMSTYTDSTMDTMPLLAYNLVWYEYYRDRNYIADNFMTFPQASGQMASNIDSGRKLDLKQRDFMKGYFTAALPFTQRGAEVLMPLAGQGTVTYLDPTEVWVNGSQSVLAGALDNNTGVVQDVASGLGAQLRNIDEVELTSSSVSINDLRSAVRLQEWLERNAVGGSRYVESIQAHFGERPQDSRLQRPEFIGGGRINVKISEVVNTAWSLNQADESVPAGNMSGHGVTYGNTNSFRYHCFEHGFIIGIMSIMPVDSYHQGIPRMFRRRSFLDYPWPTFAKLGEQEVYNWELFASAAALDNDGVFGYQSRYAEWKQSHNTTHGEFHDTLNFWTLTREFGSLPVLGEDFVRVESNLPDRIFAVSGAEGGDNFWCYIYNNISVIRPLPYFGTPTL